jgi:hypothetical protein
MKEMNYEDEEERDRVRSTVNEEVNDESEKNIWSHPTVGFCGVHVPCFSAKTILHGRMNKAGLCMHSTDISMLLDFCTSLYIYRPL